jgi:hypothetical protein
VGKVSVPVLQCSRYIVSSILQQQLSQHAMPSRGSTSFAYAECLLLLLLLLWPTDCNHSG